jgi:general secretion pathway protein J
MNLSRGSVTGFTLVELLVALMVMALLSIMSWRAIEGMVHVESATHARADDLLTLQAGLGQWTADLDAITETGEVAGLDFDGRVLRLTRRDALDTDTQSPGLKVVAWTVRDGRWMRWEINHLQTRQALLDAWQQAARWGERAMDQDAARQVPMATADSWQIFFYRGNAWTNPLSAEGSAALASQAATGAATGTGSLFGGDALLVTRQLAALPDGVRLKLALSPGQTVSGELVRDWARPVLGGGKS